MKVILYALLISFALGGCIRDGLGDCYPKTDAVLTFSYRGDTGDESMFGEMIDKVTLYIFNAGNGKLVATRTIEKAELNSFQGVRLALTPASYKIVCWGNAGDKSQFTGTSAYTTARLHHPDYAAGNKIASNDHLYFGEYDLTVPATGNTSGNILFRGAHIDLNIYVKGLSGEPMVEVSNLMPQYDFMTNAAQPFASTYYPATHYDPSKSVSVVQISVLRFGDDNPLVVSVKNPSGELKHAVLLSEYMALNAIAVSGINEATVSIMIEFTGAGVSVTIPEWDRNPVTPED